MSLDYKRPNIKKNLDVVIEDSRENVSDANNDSNGSNKSKENQYDSDEEAPSITLTPFSKQTPEEIDVIKAQNFVDDDIEVQLSFSMFSETINNEEEDVDFKFKRKKTRGLTLNNSVANIRTPYNSEYLTSTWEDKVKN
jgi:hypothetical protein